MTSRPLQDAAGALEAMEKLAATKISAALKGLHRIGHEAPSYYALKHVGGAA